MIQKHMLNIKMSLYGTMILLSLVALSSCTTKVNKPSVLLIAVDSLSSDTMTCFEEEEYQGFSQLCSESVRFTHAYTTSTLSQAALASVLTARYPIENRVWNNGQTFLTAKIETVSERALQEGYRTAFFSGGAPIFRKSGFAQGFELFEDNITVGSKEYYRPFQNNVKLFLNWLNREVGDDPFFSVVFVPDIQFSNVTTETDSGETRAASIRGQIQEIDETLSGLIEQLKKSGRWDNTYIALFGLNGFSPVERLAELPGTNLYSENIQVALLIKPPTKKRDKGIEWTIDENVTLVDVGHTLYELFGTQPQQSTVRLSKSVSLNNALLQKGVDWDPERPLLIESNWPVWRELSNARYAIQKGHALVIYDQDLKVFNTLVDRFQLSSVTLQDPTIQESLLETIQKLDQLKIQRWRGLESKDLRRFKMARHLWPRPDSENVIEQLKTFALDKVSTDAEMVRWSALHYYETQNWKLLAEVGRLNKYKTWEYVAEARLGKSVSKPHDVCWAIIESLDFSKTDCDDELVHSLVDLLKEKRERVETQLAFEKFLRAYSTFLMERQLAKLNYAGGLLWDTLLTGLLEPHITELYLSLPENVRLKQQIDRRLVTQ